MKAVNIGYWRPNGFRGAIKGPCCGSWKQIIFLSLLGQYPLKCFLTYSKWPSWHFSNY